MKTSVVRLTVTALLAAMPAVALFGAAQNTARLTVAAVSTRADMVTGGDVLIRLGGTTSPDIQARSAPDVGVDLLPRLNRLGHLGS